MNEPLKPELIDKAKTRSDKLVKKLLIIVVSMFGFGFALVPLYTVFCDITGLNGKPANTAAKLNEMGIDTTRTITVQFITRTAKGIPWQFKPVINEIEVHPGETTLVSFLLRMNQ